MKYDFQSVPDRSGCGSSKWNSAPNASTECVPLSVADMEFPTAPPIVTALQDLAATNILGYTEPTQRYYDAVCGWMQRRHDYTVQPEEIITTPGVVYALGLLVEALSAPGEGVIIMPPVYYPFDMSVLLHGRSILYAPLTLGKDRYTIDFDALERQAARPDARLLMFCSPHNPVGRVWSREELERVVEICERNGVFIIDDEIHNDLIMPGHTHTVLANISERARQICAVCTAPSKTFNLAGLQCSNIVIANKEARAKAQAANLVNMLLHLNIFAYRACEAAYTQCEAWLDELLCVVADNAAYVTAFMAEHFPEIHVFPLEGTYLLWLDMRALGMTHKELETLMKQDAGIYLDEGAMFGAAGRGFERINLACARVTLERAMQRFRQAVEAKRAQWAAQGKPYHKTLAAGDMLEDFSYDTPHTRDLSFAQTRNAPTLLIFSRYYTCSLCQALLAQLCTAWPRFQELGIDVKVVLQSTPESVAAATQDAPLPFDVICDPDAKLYDRYNVFEADSALAMAGGDIGIVNEMGGVKTMLLSMFGGEQQETEGRAQQLPAVFAIAQDGTVRYAHYAAAINDMPDLQAVARTLCPGAEI